jgi:hypothetical protein
MGHRQDDVLIAQMRARMLAKHAVELAKEGRKRESERIFRKAFEEIGRMRGPVGNLKNDVSERSKLATVLADEAVSAGLSATFAVRMWRVGCNSDGLDADERGATQMFYPVEIMGMAMREKGCAGEEDAAPAVSVPCEEERKKEGRLSKILNWLGLG